MIPWSNYVAFLGIDFVYLIFGFCGMFWESFYPLLTKDLFFSEDKNIALSRQCDASFDIL